MFLEGGPTEPITTVMVAPDYINLEDLTKDFNGPPTLQLRIVAH